MMNNTHVSYGFIVGDKVELRPGNPNHAEKVTNWFFNPQVWQTSRDVIPTSVDSIRKWMGPVAPGQRALFFEIWHRTDNCLIGLIELKDIDWINRNGTIGYGIGETAYWNQGLMSEAVDLMLRYGFQELNLHRIHASCLANNLASAKCMEKAGMVHESNQKDAIFMQGEFMDLRIYRILQSEWENHQHST